MNERMVLPRVHGRGMGMSLKEEKEAWVVVGSNGRGELQ